MFWGRTGTRTPDPLIKSYLPTLSPEGRQSLEGCATAFAGPLLVGWVTLATDSQRAGMATILGFLAVGLILLLPLREPEVQTTAP